MKKKILLLALMIAIFACFFALSAGAETPKNYIEFKVKLSGDADYIVAYTKDVFPTDPKFDFNEKFYSDIDFTQEISKSDIVGLDLSNATPVNGGKSYVVYVATPNAPYANCKEIKWFNVEGSCKTISAVMFQNWTALEYFDFGIARDVVDRAFGGSGLKELVIPKTVTAIMGGAFSGCKSLKSVKLEGSFKTMASSAFSDCTSLESVDLGDEITTISECMFKNCTALKSIEIPSSVTEIKSQAFYGCKALTNVKICEGVPYVGDSMFWTCSALASIELPSTITEIKNSAFRECNLLTSITIPENVTSIGHLAFFKAGITSLHIPAKVTMLGYQVAEETPITSLTFAENSQLKFIDHRAFMKCYSLEGVVILPKGLEEIDYGLFSNCTSLKAVKIPDTVVKYTDNGALFTSCSSLEFVQLSKNVDIIPNSMFENCVSLKAISIPEGVTTLGSKALRNCTSLQAIYLPSTITTLGVTSNYTDMGSFYQSNNIYFVQEAFNVFDGDKLIGESFVMPEKPEVYYMPSSLSFLGNAEFQDCKYLNSCIVFPEGVTSAAGCAQGAFQNVGKLSPVTIVFLGDMEAIQIKQSDSTYSNISFVFANPNDKDLNSLTFTIGSHGSNKMQTNTYMYFCAGNVIYDLSTFKAENNALYKVLESDFAKTENTQDSQPHFKNPNKSVPIAPTCVNNRGENAYCFCGAEIGIIELENSALGHEYDLEKGATKTNIEYANYVAKGNLKIKCARCEEQSDNEVAPIIKEFKGVSTKEKGNGLTFGYIINYDALDQYVVVNKTSVSLGFVVAVQAFLGENQPLTQSGEKAGDKVVKFEIYNSSTYEAGKIRYIGADFILNGNWDKTVDLDGDGTNETDIKEVIFYMAGYIIDGSTLSYINSTSSDKEAGTVYYNQIQ